MTSTPLTARSRNLVRFAHHLPSETMHESFAGDYAFRDAGSRFSLLKSPHTAPGPDECYGLFARDARLVFRKLLGLTVCYDGLAPERQAAIRGYNSMNYYRSHVQEVFVDNGIEPMPPTEGECMMWFATADLLCVRYRFVNKSSTDVPLHLSFASQGDEGEDCSVEVTERGFRFHNRQSVGPQSYVSRAELRSEDADIHFTGTAATLTSTPVARTIPANGSLTCRFAIRFTLNDEPFPEWKDEPWSEASLESSITTAEAAYAALPQLPEAMRGHYDLTLKAAGTLRSLRYLDRAPQGKPVMTIHAGKTGCGATWFWDTGVSLPGLGLMQERETAVGALRLLTGGVRDDGMPPVTCEYQAHTYYGYQMPILAWGAGHYLAACPDMALLAEIYPPLCRYVRHWLDNYRLAWGLVVHPTGCSCLDDAVRWHSGTPLCPSPGQPWHEQKWGTYSPTSFAAPDINGYLVLECRSLAQMAEALGRADEATVWRREADELAAAINEHLLDPDTWTYQDRNIESGVFTGIVNLASFIPVYAGIASSEIATHLCRDYLLSPEHFLTELPFAVIDRAHPTFRPGGFLHAPEGNSDALVQHAYWRGRTWIHANNWYLGALWQSGFQKEADQLADRILTAVNRSEGINECYDSLTGFPNGHPEFMWSSAAVLMMAHGFYQHPPVSELRPTTRKEEGQ